MKPQPNIIILSIALAGAAGFSSLASAQTRTVEFVGSKLKVNGQPFFIKCINDSILPIRTFATQFGVCYYDPTASPNPFTCPGIKTAYDIDFFVEVELGLTAALKANSYRIFNKVTLQPSPLLRRAKENKVMVIAGYWIDYYMDFTFPPSQRITRQEVINEFVNYITWLKKDPNYDAVLMIGLSNENNQHWCEWATGALACADCSKDVQAREFYKLMNEMARLAKANDPDPRPIIIVSAELGDIGNPTRSANDASLPSIDGWGINAYRGKSFTVSDRGIPKNLFRDFENLTKKPLVITEFGMDAWNGNPTPQSPTGGPDEDTQQEYIGLLWDEIKAEYQNPNGVTAGGAVFSLVDSWWQRQGDSWTMGVAQHNPGGWKSGTLPDGEFDIEFFGIFDRQPGQDLFIDKYVPRKAAFKVLEKFSQP